MRPFSKGKVSENWWKLSITNTVIWLHVSDSPNKVLQLCDQLTLLSNEKWNSDSTCDLVNANNTGYILKEINFVVLAAVAPLFHLAPALLLRDWLCWEYAERRERSARATPKAHIEGKTPRRVGRGRGVQVFAENFWFFDAKMVHVGGDLNIKIQSIFGK